MKMKYKSRQIENQQKSPVLNPVAPIRIVLLRFTPWAHSLSLTGILPSAFLLRGEPSCRVLILSGDKLKTPRRVVF